MSIQVGLSFGAFAPSLREQLAEHGITDLDVEFDHYQKDSEAIARLHVRGLMRDSEADRIRRVLLKNIEKFLRDHVNARATGCVS